MCEPTSSLFYRETGRVLPTETAALLVYCFWAYRPRSGEAASPCPWLPSRKAVRLLASQRAELCARYRRNGAGRVNVAAGPSEWGALETESHSPLGTPGPEGRGRARFIRSACPMGD